MAGKQGDGTLNRSQAIRDFLVENPDSKAREVIQGLSGKGISVSEDLVYAVKRKMGKGKGRRKQTRRAAVGAASNGQTHTAAGDNTAVAEQTGKTNKSQLVRDYLEANRDIPASSVVGALAQRGVKVASSLVYSIKAKMGTGKRRGRPPGKRAVAAPVNGAAAPTASAHDIVSTIRKVKNLASEVGGLKKLMGLVEALSE